MINAAAALLVELDAWAGAGQVATFWWRDDDAAAPGAALDRLLAAAGAVPIALAVVPMRAEPALAAALDASGGTVAALQHGYAHVNHAVADAKKAEFTTGREIDAMTAEVRTGFDRLAAMFGRRFAPIFVPPWNRCPAALVGGLARLGHRVISTYGPRAAPAPSAGLIQVNTHADPIDWRGTRRFVGAVRLAEALRLHLAARRAGKVDAAEPTGLLTHHLDLTPDDIAVIGRLVADIAVHPAARWLAANALMALP